MTNVAFIVALLFHGCLIAFAKQRPNVVLIVVDDLGWGDVSFHGSTQVKTPNIDALAATGVILNNYYVSPICTPSRSALLSGRHPIHTGMQHDVLNAAEPWAFPLKFRLLPEYLKKLNYKTHAVKLSITVKRVKLELNCFISHGKVGKWHLGFYRPDYFPTKRGFDTHFGYLAGHSDYFDHSNLEDEWGLDLRRGFDRVAEKYAGQYSTEFYGEESSKLIENHNQTSPLFLYLAFQAVHAGNLYQTLQVPQKYIDRFENIADVNRRKFVAMVSAVDDAIGSVVESLAHNGMLDNTLIMLSTDNGGATGGQLGRIDGSYGSNWPLRGVKYTLWEGGVRGVGLIWSKPISRQPRTYNNLMYVSDLMPTIYDAIGGNIFDLPTDLYGVSHWFAINKQLEVGPRNNLLHNIDDVWKVYALRSGNYKLISGTMFGGIYDTWFMPPGEKLFTTDNFVDSIQISKTGQLLNGVNINPDLPIVINCTVKDGAKCDLNKNSICLFNILDDPCEKNNIAASNPRAVKMLQRMIDGYNATAVPPGNKPKDERSRPSLHGYYWDHFDA